MKKAKYFNSPTDKPKKLPQHFNPVVSSFVTHRRETTRDLSPLTETIILTTGINRFTRMFTVKPFPFARQKTDISVARKRNFIKTYFEILGCGFVHAGPMALALGASYTFWRYY